MIFLVEWIKGLDLTILELERFEYRIVMKVKKDSKGGFTLAELLITIGVLSILLSIGMISIVKYQKSLKLTEMDTIAKQLFLVAQNNMTEAKSTGKWQRLKEQYKGSWEKYAGYTMNEVPSDFLINSNWPSGGIDEQHEYRYIHHSNTNPLDDTILNIMLPYGAIDESVRREGSYIIEYDYKTATVYGVFYTDSKSSISYGIDIMGSTGLDKNKGREYSKDGKNFRKGYKTKEGACIIGYYGGAVAEGLSSTVFEKIDISIKNENKLQVVITDPNYLNGATHVSLTITGEDSKNSKVIRVEYGNLNQIERLNYWWSIKENSGVAIHTITLDDITKQSGHFSDLFPELIPGENIIIKAEVSSNKVLTAPVKAQVFTNSLFGHRYEIDDENDDENKKETVVTIGNIRHLQNLSPKVSNVQGEIERVEQISSFDWTEFASDIGEENVSIYLYDEFSSLEMPIEEGKIYGIVNPSIKEYEGNGYTISNISIQENESGNVGLFSEIGKESVAQDINIKNVIVDGIVSESTIKDGNAGALVGIVNNGSSIVAENIVIMNPTVKANSGIAGGCIGTVRKGILKNCSVYLTDGIVNDVYTSAAEKYEMGSYNLETGLIGTNFSVYSENGGCVGGLIGKIEASTIQNSFSAVPVIAIGNGIAGGLIGKTERNDIAITNSYVGGYTKDGVYSSYQNIASLGDEEAVSGGFIGQDSAKKTTIENSYSTASTYGKVAGGLVGKATGWDKAYKNSYIVGQVLTSKDNGTAKGLVGMKEYDETVQIDNSYYLKDTNSNNAVEGDEGVSYNELQTVFVTDNSKQETYSYDPFFKTEGNPSEYPFKMVTNNAAYNRNNKAHYGDWPIQEAEYDAGLLYYEVINGEIYYHGYLAKYIKNQDDIKEDTFKECATPSDTKVLQNGLITDSGKYVTEDGYLLVIPKDSDPAKILVSISETNQEASEIYNDNLKNCVQRFDKDRFSSGRLREFEEYDLYYFALQDKVTKQTNITLGEQKFDRGIEEHIAFSFYPSFADTVQINNEKQSIYYIRSARQLSNMHNSYYVSQISAKDTTIRQTLDISYENISFTQNGLNITYSYKTIPNMYADYTVDKVSNNSNKSRCYVIKGLDKTFIHTIENGSTITGVTLLNSKIQSDDKRVASFAIYNKGIIESCGVRSEYANSKGYDQVQVIGSENVAGFVYENGLNQGIIRNCYFIGSIRGDNASGFLFSNHETVENSYANVIISADKIATGFVNFVSENKTIRNSFVVGKVISKQGLASGFMRFSDDNSKISNSYTALFELSGKQVMKFGASKESVIQCNWLENSWVNGEVLTYYNESEDQKGDIQGDSISYELLSEKGNEPTTYKYMSSYENIDTEHSTYPFAVNIDAGAYAKLEFFGDWPKKDEEVIIPPPPSVLSGDVGVLYYEIVDGEFYWHGYMGHFTEGDTNPDYREVYKEEDSSGNVEGKGLSKGLLTIGGKYVSEDGYLIALPKGTDLSKIAVAFSNDKNSLVGERHTMSKLVAPMAQSVVHIDGYDLYYFSGEQYVNQWNSAYFIIGENISQYGYPEFGQRTSFSFEFYLADSVHSSVDDQNTYYIRSARHLNNFSEKLAWSLANNEDVTFIQTFDISYEDVEFTENGKDVTAKYKFTTAKNISADYISLKCSDNERTYVIKGLNQTFVTSIESTSTFKGVTLINSKTNGPAFANLNKGIIDSCIVRGTEDEYSNVQIQGSYVGAFVDDNQQGGVIHNSYLEGSITGSNMSGFVRSNQGNIENCYTNVIMDSKGYAVGFIDSNNGGTIKNCFVIGSITTDGDAYGFVKNQWGSIDDCYTDLFHISGSNVYPFGKD